MEIPRLHLWDRIGLCLFAPICMVTGWVLGLIVLGLFTGAAGIGATAFAWALVLLVLIVPAMVAETPFYAWRHWLLKGIEPPSEAEAARRAAVVRFNRRIGWAAAGVGFVIGLVQGLVFPISEGAA